VTPDLAQIIDHLEGMAARADRASLPMLATLLRMALEEARAAVRRQDHGPPEGE